MTGIDLIAKERREQLEKHCRSVRDDTLNNDKGQLRYAVLELLGMEDSPFMPDCPRGWNRRIWYNMSSKSYKNRLIISGALIAAEIDRINYIDNENEKCNREDEGKKTSEFY